jgi:hypothetical protein
MTMISKAHRCQLTLPGLEDGRSYLVKRDDKGWWVEPIAPLRPKRRRWSGSQKDLTEHLDALAGEGFSFEPSQDQAVPPCRF